MCSNVVYGLYELKIAMYGYVHAMLSWMYLLQQDIPNMNKHENIRLGQQWI